MKFTARTTAPSNRPRVSPKNEQIKSLLFQAVKLLVEDNEEARQELLQLLNKTDA